MKKNMNLGTVVAVGALLFAGTTKAQTPDTVKVYNNGPDTVKITQPAPAPQPVPAPMPADDGDGRTDAPLRATEFGIRYYPTFAALRVRTYNGDVVDGQITMNHGYGAFIGHNFNRHVGVVLEVDYNEVSQKYRDRDLDRVVKLNYVNIPVLLSLNTNKAAWVNWNFVAGPQFGVNIGSNISGDSNGNADTLRATVAVRRGDVGLAYGTGLEFALNPEHTFRIDVGFRGFYGLVDMNASQQSNNPDVYNIMVKATRKTYAGYIGIAFMF